ncbi:MAG: lamin tail domain-containing protein [Chloroflexota bacterium]|nr:lamin tail domain-containing protein [Chloroflexota bacterium]MBI5702514.1 lamin tail domain-containing protein [Chloroflexota bacterium]
MDRRKLILYLLLNVFVSACVTGGILFWYDRNYRSASLSPVQPALPAASQSGAPASSFDPNKDIPVEIVSIVGAGTLDAEWVVVRNAGSEAVNLSSWQLRDSDRNVFVFPNLTLNPNGAVQVHTISGTNTVIDLYWGLNNPVWESGEEAQLLDPNGNVRAVYQVP